MLNRIRLLVVDTDISQHVNKLLHHRVVRETESAKMGQRLLRMIDIENTTSNCADKDRDELNEKNVLLEKRRVPICNSGQT